MSSEDKIIPGSGAGTFGDGKVIPGEGSLQGDRSRVIPGESTPAGNSGGNPQPPQPEPPVKAADVTALVAESTRQGGLQVIPSDFENKNGSWITITSANPFEVLYLDYRQYKSITPEIVQNNHRIIAAFWADKLLIMNRGARDQIEKKYTASVVNGAEKRLETALNKLKTAASLELSFQQVDGKRLSEGFAAIADLIDLSVQDGDITENKANVIIAKGLKSGLQVYEIEQHIISVIKERGFEARAETIDEIHPFRNLWMTDEAWTARQRRASIKIELMDEYASTLQEMGEILFRKKEASEYYLRGINFLPPLVNKLTDSASRTAEFQRIIEEENDTDKKYLKILYHLNPTLPFRFRGASYMAIDKLFDDACEKPEAFWAAVELFTKDHLQIWLNESAPQVAMLIPEHSGLIGFLRFLYAVNRNYPFYINNSKFATPEDLAREIKTNQGSWVTVAQHMESGYLPTWFEAIGRADINNRYNAGLETIISSGFYDAIELKLAAAQTLMLSIDSSATVPVLTADVSEITLPEVEGGSIVKCPVRLTVRKPAFVKAEVKLDSDTEGFVISATELTFNSYTHDSEREVVVVIDSAQLTKDRYYMLNVVVTTPYDTVVVPVRVKVVFPKKAVAIKLTQYGLATALYFGVFRYLMALCLNYEGWLSGFGYMSLEYPLLVFLIVAGFISGSIYSFRLVKRIEKI